MACCSCRNPHASLYSIAGQSMHLVVAALVLLAQAATWAPASVAGQAFQPYPLPSLKAAAWGPGGACAATLDLTSASLQVSVGKGSTAAAKAYVRSAFAATLAAVPCVKLPGHPPTLIAVKVADAGCSKPTCYTQ